MRPTKIERGGLSAITATIPPTDPPRPQGPAVGSQLRRRLAILREPGDQVPRHQRQLAIAGVLGLAHDRQRSGWRGVVVDGPVWQLAVSLEDLANDFRWQGDGMAAARLRTGFLKTLNQVRSIPYLDAARSRGLVEYVFRLGECSIHVITLNVSPI